MDKRGVTKKLLLMTLGTTILAFGVFNFYDQNGITEGGVLGMLLIMKNVFGMDIAISNILLDGALILLGLKFLGKEFFGYTIFSSTVFSIAYAVFENVGYMVTVNNNILAAILGGISVGVGCSIVMNAGGASGGEDALAIILSKLLSCKIGIVYLMSDIFVLALSLSYLSWKTLLISVVAVITSGQVIGFIYKGETEEVQTKKQVTA